MKRPTLQLAVLALLLAWAMAAQLPYSGLMMLVQFDGKQHARWPFFHHGYSTKVEAVAPEYRDSGMQNGDDVIAIDGNAIDGAAQLERLRQEAKPNDILNVTARRLENGKSQALQFSFKLAPESYPGSEWVINVFRFLLLPFCCLIVGFFIVFARPNDPLAWITMTMLAAFGQFGSYSETSLLLWSPWRQLFCVYQPFLANTWPLWMVLFAIYFPIPFPQIQRHPWMGWLLGIPALIVGLPEIFGNFERINHLRRLQWLDHFQQLTDTPFTLSAVLYVFAFFALLILKRRILSDQDSRRRLRVMIAGCQIALLPTLPLVLGQIRWTPRLPPLLAAICLSFIILFPLTMAYVIVVQRAMEIRMVVRNGVRYAFARTSVGVLQIVILVFVILATVHYAQEANHRIVSLLVAATGLGVVFSIRWLTQRVAQWMDKRFFREAYNAELILSDLSSSVAGIRDVTILFETVARRISESLHVASIAFFMEAEGAFRPAYALAPIPASTRAEFRSQTGVARYLRRQPSPARVFFGDPQSWVHGAPEREQEALRTLDTQLLLPMALKSRLVGIISLGPKRSEEPYSRGDIQLLGAVATQAGLALENAQLAESVIREVAQRERLDRELEIAREVQQRLFPQKLPQVNGLDFAGYCRPAEGVGGDYYDFIHLSDGCLGIAVGDVSGKGIAAALMMASLQASLRGQTIKPCSTLSEMVQHINRLVFDASAENRYATFFYAQYDPNSMILRYVNAGHNPPMVWRRTDGTNQILRLSDGGTVIGLFPNYPFTEAQIQLQPKDVLVAFTDGVSEAMNLADDEYGEERLTQALCQLPPRSAADTVNCILDSVDSFTADAPQHDDITLVVVCVR